VGEGRVPSQKISEAIGPETRETLFQAMQTVRSLLAAC
jgi:hypothetical protein